jgi:hypothetical protein
MTDKLAGALPCTSPGPSARIRGLQAPIGRGGGPLVIGEGGGICGVARHFAGQDGLALVAVDESVLGPALKWEPARDGSLFPHLYGNLTLAAVRWTKPLPLCADGRHLFPDLSTEADNRV